MIAAHFDNWIFLLLVAVAMLFRWLASAAGKTSKNPDEIERRSTSAPPPPVPREPMETDEQRIRKFLEALGQPAGSQPPPPVARKRTVVSQVGPLPSPLPPLKTRPPELPQKVQPPAQFTAPPYEQKTPKPVAAAPVFEVQPGGAMPDPTPVIARPDTPYAIASQPQTEPKERETDIVALLKSPSGLRNAIILREIFGPPRSLQPVDLVGSA